MVSLIFILLSKRIDSRVDMTHNAEPEACDLLLEVDQLGDIVKYVDENNYSRVCLYLVRNSFWLVVLFSSF